MPKLEKIEFSRTRKADFLLWIQDQLINTIGDRFKLARKWEDEIIQWRAKLPEGEVDFPYEGASNLEMPLTAIHSDPVYADLFQTLHTPENYWTPVDRSGHPDIVSPFRRGLNAVEKKYIGMRQVNRRALLDNNILGTAIYKNHWEEVQRPDKEYGLDGSVQRVIKNVSRPCIRHVPLQRFYFPANAWNLDPDAQGGAVWEAEEFFVTPAQLRVMARGGDTMPTFNREAVEKVIKYEVDEQQPVDQTIREEDSFTPFENLKIRLFEVHVRFDTGTGFEDEIIAIVHLETPELLRAIYNPTMHGKRPYNATNYLPGFGIYGIGIAEIDAWAQEASTKLLNAQIDNVLLANTRMYKAPLGSNIQPGEPVYPGKIWLVGPNEDVGEVRMSEVYPSIFQSLGQMMQFAELRTGVNETRQGDISALPSRTPATSLLSMLQEGNKRFDMILSNLRDVHSEMGLRLVQNLAQHVREEPARWQRFFRQSVGQEDAAVVMSVLMQNPEEIEDSFGFAVSATSAQVNKEAEKQNFIGLLQIVGQVGAQLVQVGQMAEQTPQGGVVHETSAALYSGGVELLKQLLQRFDIQNPGEYLGNMETIANTLNAQAQGGNAATAGMGAALQPPTAAGAAPQILNPASIAATLGLA